MQGRHSSIIVGQGDTYEAALADVKSAIAFHIETFGVSGLLVSRAKISCPHTKEPKKCGRSLFHKKCDLSKKNITQHVSMRSA
ncbi:MAG: hypothetical protein A2268_02445 [Candidatus Raymondbacteria bacterium RifOxyA12_full_50_37]|uniref:Uncharacterized protein n=1 Tax=Candidatus Raymondbacteria bacterium RIFOXYD12_FULL_49_13 TaxID=1817890 RepID=A0A1F7F3D6_UNCRA|nr:MAG: hypothetical protein A2268_02445 [Candidatus Raymondbacteria bacterium RifOxyA12_full_50_37]OGJ89139.1 MAG: hypothetical protein A2248_11320 [Candidatus Raymondbacteria bacterium RIFOXYA2_FULL_49_16]OGJ96511.1 MAG: hypothetical protein A2350_05050 [Candidatus Raymondbacteria bacterium RifOxyB12_full_50_8]OGJ96621.1 MAG: hypothetical protein A2453_06435 [Candidatus Raymondbacteria bacterium RIFOXYC2_FULL_50_21]OGK01072.1 MAG: hypothetical protein A2519_16915 [Candidatus Raymondbacteria b